MTTKDGNSASRPDAENPEWTRDEIRDARPALQVFAELFGASAAKACINDVLREHMPESV